MSELEVEALEKENVLMKNKIRDLKTKNDNLSLENKILEEKNSLYIKRLKKIESHVVYKVYMSMKRGFLKLKRLK